MLDWGVVFRVWGTIGCSNLVKLRILAAFGVS